MKRFVFFLIINSFLLTLNCYSKQIVWDFIKLGFLIKTYNETKPSERQLETINNILTQDFLVNDDTTIADIEHKHPAIALDAAGNFIITWMDYRDGTNDIYFQKYNSNGVAIGVNKKVNDDTSTAGQGYPSIAMDGSGNFIIAWLDTRNGNDDIFYQRYNSIGTALGVNKKVNDDVGAAFQENPFVAMDASGNFVIAWADNRNSNLDIYFQRFNSSGIPQGINKKTNTDPGTKLQTDPSIAMDGAGNFVITWHDNRNNNYDIYFQRYNSIGITQGINTKANDDTQTRGQYNASIAMNGLGDFVIAWADERNNDFDIYFQRYNSIGIPQGNNVKVNDDSGTSGQYDPTIAMDAIGNFVIVWWDNRDLLSRPDVIGQRFYSNGNLWGINYRIVIDGVNHGEVFPVVAADVNQIYFSWRDNRRTTRWDIYGKVVGWNWDGVTSILSEKNIPATFSLYQNFPNPFNPNTTFKYSIPQTSKVTVKVYDILGNEIATLIDEEKSAGTYELTWNAASLPSGIYFYQIKAGDCIHTKKMVLLK